MRPSNRARLARAAALPMLVVSLLLGPATLAQAADEVVAGPTFSVLATEAGGTQSGLEPRGPNETDNEFKPADYDANFLWGAAIGLGVLALGGVGLLALLYRVMVQRPSQAADNKG